MNHKNNFFTLEYKKVKHSLILGIALLISVLINLPRVLQLYNVVDNLAASFTPVSIKDIVIRVLFLFVFSWLVLQFNANWKFKYDSYTKLLKGVITLLVNSALFLVVVVVFVWFYQYLTDDLMTAADKSILYFVYFVMLLILVFISGILRYQVIHQEDLLEKEFLKQQSLQNELSALKNQINPHFLFNSLNSLNSLIRENKAATTFVNKLSFMYRYILQSGHLDLVSLKDELKFLESYIYLIKTRYRDRFTAQIDIEDQWLNKEIPALALQLLVENAVKHNEISESNPLNVKLYTENDYLIVENKIQPRTTFVDSTGQGLANIDKRYVLLKEKHIVISNKNSIFKVKLPLS